MNYWLRLYTGILDDPKVQRLQPEHFKGWVNLLCLAKEKDGLLPGIEEIAFRLRIEDAQAQELIDALKARGLLDDAGVGLTPHNWSGRQYETEQTASQTGALGNHQRWHVGRGIVVDNCAYCHPDPSPDIGGDSGATSGDHRAISGRSSGDIAPNRPPNPEQKQSRSRAEADSETEAERETEAAEQRQSRGRAEAEAMLPALPAAAAAGSFNEVHSSTFAFPTVEDFVRATKPHIKNPGGFARKIWRSGEEDSAIGQWLIAKADREKEPAWPKWVFDPKEPGTVEEKKRFHRQLVEQHRAIEAEFKQEAAERETDAA